MGNIVQAMLPLFPLIYACSTSREAAENAGKARAKKIMESSENENSHL